MESTVLSETAGLARLGLDEQELQEMSPAFEQMLSLFALMQAGGEALPANATQADIVTASAKPVSCGCMRPDTEAPQESVESMLSQAPKREGSFIVIPNVL